MTDLLATAHALVKRLHAEQSFTGILAEIRDPFSVRIRRPGQKIPDEQFYRVVDGLATLWTPGQRVSVKGEGGSLVVVGNLDVSLPDALGLGPSGQNTNVQVLQAAVGTQRLYYGVPNLSAFADLPTVPQGAALVHLLFCSGDPTGWAGTDPSGNRWTLIGATPTGYDDPQGPFGATQSVYNGGTLGPCWLAAFVCLNAQAIDSSTQLNLVGPAPIAPILWKTYGIVAPGLAVIDLASNTGTSAFPASRTLLDRGVQNAVTVGMVGAQWDPAETADTIYGRWYENRPHPGIEAQAWNPSWRAQYLIAVPDAPATNSFGYLIDTEVGTGSPTDLFDLYGRLQNQDGSAASANWGAMAILLGTGS